MMKTIRLQTRFLSLKNQGAGRVSVDIYNELKDDYNIKPYTAKKNSNIAYLKHFLFYNMFRSRKYDIGVAITSMDTFYLNPKKSLAICMDLIPVTDTFTIKTHYNVNIIKKFILQFVFYYSLYLTSKFKKIAFISEKTRDEFLLLFPKTPIDNTQVVYLSFNKKYRIQPRIKTGKLKLYYVGVLDHRKRIIEFIKMFMTITNPNYEFIIGGNGSLTKEVKELIKQDSRIKMLGFVNDEDMVKRYAECDIFVFPTKAEGFGMPVIEASLCGRPVITFNDGQIPNIVKKSSLNIYREDLGKTLEKLEDEVFWDKTAKECYVNSRKILKIRNHQKTVKDLIREIN